MEIISHTVVRLIFYRVICANYEQLRSGFSGSYRLKMILKVVPFPTSECFTKSDP